MLINGFNQTFNFSATCGYGNGFSYRKSPAYTEGIKNDLFSGYFADEMEWFDSRTPAATTYPTDVIQDPITDDGSSYSRRWTGYFKAPSSENYTFYLSSDDASYLWIGSYALSGWNASNAVVDNGGLHGNIEASGNINLTAGQYYPIQVFFGELGGGDVLTFSYSTPTIAKTTDLTGLIYYNPGTPGGKGF